VGEVSKRRNKITIVSPWRNFYNCNHQLHWGFQSPAHETRVGKLSSVICLNDFNMQPYSTEQSNDKWWSYTYYIPNSYVSFHVNTILQTYYTFLMETAVIEENISYHKHAIKVPLQKFLFNKHEIMKRTREK